MVVDFFCECFPKNFLTPRKFIHGVLGPAWTNSHTCLEAAVGEGRWNHFASSVNTAPLMEEAKRCDSTPSKSPGLSGQKRFLEDECMNIWNPLNLQVAGSNLSLQLGNPFLSKILLTRWNPLYFTNPIFPTGRATYLLLWYVKNALEIFRYTISNSSKLHNSILFPQTCLERGLQSDPLPFPQQNPTTAYYISFQKDKSKLEWSHAKAVRFISFGKSYCFENGEVNHLWQLKTPQTLTF